MVLGMSSKGLVGNAQAFFKLVKNVKEKILWLEKSLDVSLSGNGAIQDMKAVLI